MNIVKRLSGELFSLTRGRRGRALATIAAMWGLLLGTRMIFPVILPYLREDFGLSLTAAGLLITIIWLAYALGQTPSGFLIDRYGERRLVAISMAIIVTSLIAVLLAPVTVVLYAAAGLFGLGMSIYTIARLTALSSLYSERLGSALGVTLASGDIGQTFLPPAAGAIAVLAVWQFGLGFTIPLIIVGAIFLWIYLPSTNSTDRETQRPSVDGAKYVIATLRRPAIVIMGWVLFLYLFVWQTFTAFYPTYLIEVKGFSPGVTGILFGLFFAVGVIVKPLAGAAYDRFGVGISLPIVHAGAVLGLAALPFLDDVFAIAAVTILIGTMLGSGSITQSYLAQVLPDRIQGTGLGIVRSATATLGATGPLLFGFAADQGFFDIGYIILAILIGFSILIALRLPRE